MTRPRVLFLVDSMNVGGIERQIIELLTGIRTSGRYHSFLSILNPGGIWDAEALEIVEENLGVSRQSYFDIRFPFRLIRQAKVNGIELIHTYGWMSGAVGLFAARWLRIPVVNASIRNAFPSVWHHHIGGWCARWSDAAVANSHAGLVGYGLDHLPESLVIHNGVNLERFENVEPASLCEPALCMVANFTNRKDHTTLIRALPTLRKEFPTLCLVLIGRDAGTLQQCRDLITELGLEEAVHFLTNVTHPEPYIAGSVVGVLASPTTGEGIANAILEYMAMGKPVIATDCGGNRESVVDGVNGFLVPRFSPDAIAERVTALLKSPQLVRRMGVAGQKWVRQRFSLDNLVAQHETLYHKLLSSGSS